MNRLAVLDPNACLDDGPNHYNPAVGSGPATVMQEVITVVGMTADPHSGFPNAVREWCINTAAIDPYTKVRAGEQRGWMALPLGLYDQYVYAEEEPDRWPLGSLYAHRCRSESMAQCMPSTTPSFSLSETEPGGIDESSWNSCTRRTGGCIAARGSDCDERSFSSCSPPAAASGTPNTFSVPVFSPEP